MDISAALDAFCAAIDPAAAKPIEDDVRLAIAIASFRVRPAQGEPFRHAQFGAIPTTPVGPMFMRLDEALEAASPPIAGLLEAMDDLARTYVAEADAQEAVDAHGNSAQYLYAAGRLDVAFEKILGLLGI